LDDGEAKGYLVVATQAFENEHFGECLIECRKAIYVEYFSRYDIKWFETTESNPWMGALLAS